MKWKANISNEFQASNVTNGFDLGNDFDLWIFKVNFDLDLSLSFMTMAVTIWWPRSGERSPT